MIDLPLAKQPGTGGEKMHVDESASGQPARTRYRVIERAGNRAAWVELQPLTGRTHQLRVHMLGDRPSDRRRRQIWRPGRVPDRRDQPQAASPRAAAADRPSRRRQDRRHRRAARPFRREHGRARLRSRARRPAARRGQIRRDRPKASARRCPPPPRRAARSAAASGAAGGAADASRTAPSTGRIARRCSPSSPTSPSARSAVDGPVLVHVPVVVVGPDRLRFHVARGNRAAQRSTAGGRSSPASAPTPISARTGTARRPGADLELSRGRGGRAAAPARRGRSWPTCSTISAPPTRRGSRPSRPGPAPR